MRAFCVRRFGDCLCLAWSSSWRANLWIIIRRCSVRAASGGSCVRLDASARKKSLGSLLAARAVDVGRSRCPRVPAASGREGFLAETAAPRDPLTSCFLGSKLFPMPPVAWCTGVAIKGAKLLSFS